MDALIKKSKFYNISIVLAKYVLSIVYLLKNKSKCCIWIGFYFK